MSRRQQNSFFRTTSAAVALLLVLLSPLCFTSCGSKKIIGHTGVGERTMLSKRQFLQAYDALQPAPAVEASGMLHFYEGSKEVESQVKWSLERDRSFVLSLRPLGLFEVAKLSVSEDKIVALDRMGRRGFETDPAGILLQSIHGLTGYDPKILSAVVQNEPFTLSSVGRGVLKQMDFRQEGRFYHFSQELHRAGARVEHIFDIDLNLIESRVVLPGQFELKVLNSSFVKLSDDQKEHPTPAQIDVVATLYELGGVQKYRLSIALGKMSGNVTLERTYGLPKSYHSLTIQELVKLIKDF